MRATILVLAVIGVVSCSAGEKDRIVAKPKDLAQFNYYSKDQEIKTAIEKAKSTLDEFIAKLDDSTETPHQIKVPIRKGTDAIEEMWIEVKSYKEGVFHGRLDSDPVIVKGLKRGDAMSVR